MHAAAASLTSGLESFCSVATTLARLVMPHAPTTGLARAAAVLEALAARGSLSTARQLACSVLDRLLPARPTAAHHCPPGNAPPYTTLALVALRSTVLVVLGNPAPAVKDTDSNSGAAPSMGLACGQASLHSCTRRALAAALASINLQCGTAAHLQQRMHTVHCCGYPACPTNALRPATSPLHEMTVPVHGRIAWHGLTSFIGSLGVREGEGRRGRFPCRRIEEASLCKHSARPGPASHSQPSDDLRQSNEDSSITTR
ncbi:hypothetical protein P171DRAFT_490834 [Karstenula rhodostoma CBS 690.94]|uniref:Uncharacterized protein n=1 Tax=Karstenula rhodostoma CBS 690.94 TaxID=1392251 RepID=A0A9P4U787_9PLEO|nr:hypothetical protein P171DRAFT_490834 [Karstenula rhodostoma CBS 690.94]